MMLKARILSLSNLTIIKPLKSPNQIIFNRLSNLSFNNKCIKDHLQQVTEVNQRQ